MIIRPLSPSPSRRDSITALGRLYLLVIAIDFLLGVEPPEMQLHSYSSMKILPSIELLIFYLS